MNHFPKLTILCYRVHVQRQVMLIPYLETLNFENYLFRRYSREVIREFHEFSSKTSSLISFMTFFKLKDENYMLQITGIASEKFSVFCRNKDERVGKSECKFLEKQKLSRKGLFKLQKSIFPRSSDIDSDVTIVVSTV